MHHPFVQDANDRPATREAEAEDAASRVTARGIGLARDPSPLFGAGPSLLVIGPGGRIRVVQRMPIEALPGRSLALPTPPPLDPDADDGEPVVPRLTDVSAPDR